MKKLLLIFISAIFLIGNYHVVTDWCDDLENGNDSRFEQAVSSHEPSNDLCGHCGHMGLNILLIENSELYEFTYKATTKPDIATTSFVSVLTPPPTPPPVIIS